jgi:outer membrane protein insertion porin family
MIRRIIYSCTIILLLIPCSIIFAQVNSKQIIPKQIIPKQVISKIELSRISKFKESDYLTWAKLSSGMGYSAGIEDSVKLRIITALKERGYFHPLFNLLKFEMTDTVKGILKINLTEGLRTTIRKIYFTKSFKDSLQVVNIISSLENSVFSKANVESVFGEVMDYYEDRGYPFVSIKIESFEMIDDSSHNHFSDIYLSIDEGVKSAINKIEIAGNTKTKDYVIFRELQISKDEVYSQKKIDDISSILNRLRFFEPVETPSYYFNTKDEGILKITVKEKQTNFFDGIVGYVPAATNKQSGYFTGFVNINLRNLFGTGRTALFSWQQETRFTQDLELRYLEPWLFGYPFNFEVGLVQRKQDSTYVQRTFDAKLEYLATQEISTSLLLSSMATIPTILISNLFTVFNSSELTYGVNLKIDTRDDYYAPTEGVLLNNSYKYSSKKITGPANFITADTKTDISLQRLEFDLSIFKQIMSRQIAALGIHARELRGSEFEVSDLYFLGGTNSLRGYREKQFQGNRIAWSNLEYRYLLSKRTYALIFFDTGYYLSNADAALNTPQLSGFLTGYGFGLNLETSLGILGVSFGLGKGDSFSQGKIHFGITNEF